MPRPRLAIIDDYQHIALASADWASLDADIQVFHDPWRDEDHTAAALAPFDIVAAMRERTPFPERLIARLPNLRLLAMTGRRTTMIDVAACTRRGILVSCTENPESLATAELAVALILACARATPKGDANMHAGLWQQGVPIGLTLRGRTLGIAGLGLLGTHVAGIGRAFGMHVIAWSPNLTDARAQAAGATLVGKQALFERSDVLSLHLVLSDSTRGIFGAEDLQRLRPGTILVNTARAGLVQHDALLDLMRRNQVRIGLDVYLEEPLPADHPYRTMPNVVLAPHLGYIVTEMLEPFHRDSCANIAAYLAGRAPDLLNPELVSPPNLDTASPAA